MNKEELTAKLCIFIGLIVTILILHALQSYYYTIDKSECLKEHGTWIEYHDRSMGFRWNCLIPK